MASNVTFTGSWHREDEIQIRTLVAEVLDSYPDITIECFYRPVGVPYKASVAYQGRYFGPVAYGPGTLVENIKNGLPVLS